MPDRDHAPAFWRSVASTFKRDHALLFDLFNEPNHVGWSCWQHGCRIPAYNDGYGPQRAYQAVGMQQLVDAVRGTGARQPLLLSGISYAHALLEWAAHEPRDRLHQLIASEHNYGGLSPCEQACQAAAIATHGKVPVLFGELGENDCLHGYIDSTMAFADAHGIGYLGWAWDAVAPGSWTCRGGPSLITDYRGTPTAFGIGFRDHLRSLGTPLKPS
jgi:endoglucanase